MIHILKFAAFPFRVVRILARSACDAIVLTRREEELASKFRTVFGEVGDRE